MKKFLLLSAAAILGSTLSTFAQGYSEYEVQVDSESLTINMLLVDCYGDRTAKIVRNQESHETLMGSYADQDLVIPSEVEYDGNMYAVIGIEFDAFDGAEMTSIYIPENVTYIYGNPFMNCPKLQEFKGPHAKHDGRSLFLEETYYYDAQNIYVSFANGSEAGYDLVLEGNALIGEDAFRNATPLKSVSFILGDIRLRNNCFRGCSNLTDIKVYATEFMGSTLLAENYDMHNTENIFCGFFKDCPNIEYVHFYGDEVSHGCSNIHLDGDKNFDSTPILVCERAISGLMDYHDYWKNAQSRLVVNMPSEIEYTIPLGEDAWLNTVFADIVQNDSHYEFSWNLPETDIVAFGETETPGEMHVRPLKMGTYNFSLTYQPKEKVGGVPSEQRHNSDNTEFEPDIWDMNAPNRAKGPNRAKSLSQYSPVVFNCTVRVKETSGINSIDADNQEVDADAIYYSVNGMQVDKENLAPGIYIARGSKTSKKILVK